MAYLRKQQLEALLEFSPDQLRILPVSERVELAVRHHELELQKREAFWNTVESIALGLIPIVSFLGFTSLFREKK